MAAGTQIHETNARGSGVSGSSGRGFGFVVAAAFAVIGLTPLAHSGALRWGAFAIGVAFFVIAPTLPGLLRPFNRQWLKTRPVLRRVVIQIVMRLLFFLVIAPVGIAMRVIGNDPLRRRRDPAASTYWIDRAPPGPPPAAMKHRF
jgi:hypothetical protein